MALGELNVGYRPLNPADDVAGLAGQKQAVAEFSAASANTARELAAGQAVVDSTLRAHDTFARLAQQAQKLELDKQQAAHTMNIQREELSMQQRLMPGKLEAMALANEGQSIDNAFAAENERAAIDGMYVQNEGQAISNQYAAAESEAKLESARLLNKNKENELSKYKQEQMELAQIAKLHAGLQRWRADGNRVADYPDKPVFKSEAARKTWEEVEEDEEETTEHQRRELEQKKSDKQFGKLNQNQITMMGKTDAMGNPKYAGDVGDAIVDRLARMNDEGLQTSDRDMFMLDARGGSTRVGERWGEMKDNVLVLTEAGLAEQKRLNAARKPKMQVTASEDVFYEGKLVGQKVSRKAVAHTRAERIGAIYKDYQTAIDNGTMTPRQASQLATQREVEENTLHIGVGHSEKDLGTITRHHAQQKRVIRWFQDGTSKIVTPSGGYASTGAPATDTDEPAAGGEPDQESAPLSDAEVASNIREKYDYRKPNPRVREPDLKNPITLVTARIKSKQEEIKSNNKKIEAMEKITLGRGGRTGRDRRAKISGHRNNNIRLSEEIKEAKDDLEMLRQRRK